MRKLLESKHTKEGVINAVEDFEAVTLHGAGKSGLITLSIRRKSEWTKIYLTPENARHIAARLHSLADRQAPRSTPAGEAA